MLEDPENLKKELMQAQEISFAKVLAGNDKKLRDRAVKKLIKWLAVRSRGKTAFTEENFHRIWTGLFYCMWMSDKFLVQEELAESISKLIHCFRGNRESALLFIKCFNKIMGMEWPGIDQHRIDKFCMLIRRFLRQSLEYCKGNDWDDSLVTSLIDIFEETVLNDESPKGYLLHFVDIYPEELAKVSRGKLKKETVLMFIEPIIKLLSKTNDERVREAISLFFGHIIRQTDIGLEYEEKLAAWKRLGMPSSQPEDLCKVEEEPEEKGEDSVGDDSETEDMAANGALDPRAGKVDAILPQIPIDYEGVIKLLQKHGKTSTVTVKGKRSLRLWETKFEKLKEGKMPDTIKKPEILNEKKKKRRHTSKCVNELMKFTRELDKKDLELVCDEIDSDEEEPEPEVKSSDEENKTSKLVSPEKKSKRKKERKKEKPPQKKHPPEEAEESKELKKTQPKSPAFTVEHVESNKLTVTPSKKRKALTAWQVHDLEVDSEEYKKISVPKIIKLEVKGSSSATGEEIKTEIDDTPVRKSPLTPSFWDKAKEKASRKNKTVFLNPLFSGDASKTSKRISFALDRNEAQENEEYLEEVRNSPSIPFDGTKRPIQSALKSGLSPSPINPFYRFKKFK